jgi:hypothetical protein
MLSVRMLVSLVFCFQLALLGATNRARAISGAIMLARVPRAERRLKEIDGIGLIGAYLGTDLAASALLLMVAAPQLVTCVDS